jgi:hypothetical protein
VTIEVADACGGLPPGKVDDLFAPLVQRGENRSGFGLGLAIARQAVEAHGGSIDVRDDPGDGCVFTIELPSPARGTGNLGTGDAHRRLSWETVTGVREVDKLVTAHKQREGGGFIVRRPFPAWAWPAVDPVSAARRDGTGRLPAGRSVGAPDHPHRGFETVDLRARGRDGARGLGRAAADRCAPVTCSG